MNLMLAFRSTVLSSFCKHASTSNSLLILIFHLLSISSAAVFTASQQGGTIKQLQEVQTSL